MLRLTASCLAALLLVSCGDPGGAGSPPGGRAADASDVSVRAEIADDASGAFAVDATDPGPDGGHQVRLTWGGPGAITLDDARFTHHVQGDEGHLLIAGRGCGWNWWEDEGEPASACTADLMIIEVASGDSHAYPVTIIEELGPLRLAPGTYVVEERIEWWEDPDPSGLPDAEPTGMVVVRLTYEVAR